jgi:hemerythrin superfamily protein
MTPGAEQINTTTARLLAGYVADDAISILREDHRRIDDLFRQFDKTRGDTLRGELAQRICIELLIHARVEEEIFYPALREAIEADELMNEADIEHDAAARLIAEIMRMRPGEGHYCARVRVLGDYVRHHVQHEQNRMFSMAREARLDMRALGARILERKKELQQGLLSRRPMAWLGEGHCAGGMRADALESL